MLTYFAVLINDSHEHITQASTVMGLTLDSDKFSLQEMGIKS